MFGKVFGFLRRCCCSGESDREEATPVEPVVVRPILKSSPRCSAPPIGYRRVRFASGGNTLPKIRRGEICDPSVWDKSDTVSINIESHPHFHSLDLTDLVADPTDPRGQPVGIVSTPFLCHFHGVMNRAWVWGARVFCMLSTL